MSTSRLNFIANRHCSVNIVQTNNSESLLFVFFWQLLQQLKKLICDLCRLYNLPQHPDVEMLDQPLPAGPVGPDRKARLCSRI